MTPLVLFHLMHNEREGIIPVNTFVLPEFTPFDYLEKVVYHVNTLIQNFVKENLNEGLFWFEDKDKFDPEEEEAYGYVYAELKNDEEIALTEDPYQAAKQIVELLVGSDFWEDCFELNSNYTLTNYKVADIPATEPFIDTTVPEDSRYAYGDKVVDSYGRSFKYLGVKFNPLYPDDDRADVDYNNKHVRIPVPNHSYVNVKAIAEFVKEADINVYPVPHAMKRRNDKKIEWFAQSPTHPKVEGFGKTQKEAKEQLAFNVLSSKEK